MDSWLRRLCGASALSLFLTVSTACSGVSQTPPVAPALVATAPPLATEFPLATEAPPAATQATQTPTPTPKATAKPKTTPKPTNKPAGYYKPPGWDGSSDVDCPDFDSHAHAQSFFKGTGGTTSSDPYRLDSDHDGQACESLP